MHAPLIAGCSLAFALGVIAQKQEHSRPSDPPWVDLFDGKTLDGWVKRSGAAKFAVIDGLIVGTTVPDTGNTFLCTSREYGDFDLELELKGDRGLNSGVQIRSQIKGRDRVFGYQAEVDPTPRAWSGGIYDEARRGWIAPLAKDSPARQAFRLGEWNRYRIRCEGDWIRTWVNDVPITDLRDAMTLKGLIGLQVHGVGKRKDPLQMRWRNLRVRDLGEHRWRSILDPKTRAGFTALPGGEWTERDGVLVGRHAADDPRHGVLLSDAVYGDFTAKIVYRIVRGNSGLYFRCEPTGDGVAVAGFQAEIDPQKEAGMLYETRGRARVAVPSAKLVKKAFRSGEFNEMIVSAHGRRVVVTLNGHRMAEVVDDPGRTRGHFGIQLHGGQDVEIEVRELSLLERVPAQRPSKADGNGRGEQEDGDRKDGRGKARVRDF